MYCYIGGYCGPDKLTCKINHHTPRDAIIQENSLLSFSAFNKNFLKLLKRIEEEALEVGTMGMTRWQVWGRKQAPEIRHSSFRRAFPHGSPLLWQEKGVVRPPNKITSTNIHSYQPIWNLFQHELIICTLGHTHSWDNAGIALGPNVGQARGCGWAKCLLPIFQCMRMAWMRNTSSARTSQKIYWIQKTKLDVTWHIPGDEWMFKIKILMNDHPTLKADRVQRKLLNDYAMLRGANLGQEGKKSFRLCPRRKKLRNRSSLSYDPKKYKPLSGGKWLRKETEHWRNLIVIDV